MKIIKKASAKKDKICASCVLNKPCGDLPGFCLLLHYGLIALLLVLLAYFLVTMNL